MPSDAKVIASLVDSANRNELVVIVGAGVSVALSNRTLPSWVGLA